MDTGSKGIHKKYTQLFIYENVFFKVLFLKVFILKDDRFRKLYIFYRQLT